MKRLIIYEASEPIKFLGQLTEKIYRSHGQCIVWSAQDCDVIDRVLWTYTPLSFLPHGCEGFDLVSEDHPIWITSKMDVIRPVALFFLETCAAFPTQMGPEHTFVLCSMCPHPWVETMAQVYDHTVLWTKKESHWIKKWEKNLSMPA